MTANLIQANERQKEKELDIQDNLVTANGFDLTQSETELQCNNIDDIWDSELLTEILDSAISSEFLSDIFVVDNNGNKIIL